MKDFVTFFLFISISGTTFCQKIVVVDSVSKAPLSFVAFQSRDSGFYSNEKGNFDLPKDNTLLKISNLGYKPKTISSEKIKDTVFLISEEIVLDEVVLDKNKLEILLIKAPRKAKCMGSFAISEKQEIVTLIKPLEKLAEAYIEKITIPFTKTWGTLFEGRDKKNVRAIVRLNIYEVENGKFGKKFFSSEAIDIVAFSKDKIEIDVSNRIISFSENGLAFGIEMLGYYNSNSEIIGEKLYARPQLTDKTNPYYEAETFFHSVFNDKEFIRSLREISSYDNIPCKNPGNNLSIGFELSLNKN